jgi:YbbR domain-containing protein
LEHPPTHYQIYVDARHVGAGTHELPVQVDGLPFGIESKVEPSTVEIKLEEKLQKEVHVEADVIGNVQDGFRIGPPVINPSKVLVRGAESKLGQVTSVKAVVYLNNETKLLQKTVKLQAYGDNGPISQVNVYPEVATVQIPISIPNKTVPLYVQVGKAPPPGYAVDSINTKPDQVTVYGPKSYVENLQFYTVPNVDLSKVTKDTILLMPIPLHDQAVKVEPKEIEIYVKMVPAGTKNPKKYSG